MIFVECGCGRTFELDERFAGRTARCPHCGASVDVPAPPEPIPPAPPPPEPVRPPIATTREPTKFWVVLFCLLVLAPVVVPVVVHAFRTGQLVPPAPPHAFGQPLPIAQVSFFGRLAVAGVGLVLVLILKRWALCVCLLIFGLGLCVLGALESSRAAGLLNPPGVAASAIQWWPWVLEGAVVLLMAASAARVRVGPTAVTRVVQGVGALAAGAVLVWVLYKTAPQEAGSAARHDWGTVEGLRAGIGDVVRLLIPVLLTLACVAGFLHAVIVRIHAETLSRTVMGLVGIAVGLLLLGLAATSLSDGQFWQALHLVRVWAAGLFVPVLFAAGLNRLIGLTTVAVQRRRAAG
ncbi:MAG: hypothetical protein ACOC8F_03745 [Planctomycetota bacterium]